MRSVMLVALALGACGTADDQIDLIDGAAAGCDGACDTDASSDAPDGGGCLGACTPDAGDAGGGTLPINAMCEPTLEQCQSDLTCRIRDAHDGLCRPVGSVLEGQVCTAADQCGQNMACLPATPAGTFRCFVVCDVAQPARRCASSQECRPFWGDDTGVCA